METKNCKRKDCELVAANVFNQLWDRGIWIADHVQTILVKSGFVNASILKCLDYSDVSFH